MSGSYLDIAEKTFQEEILNFLLVAGWGWLAIGVFYYLGEPISLHQLRCNPLAVVHFSLFLLFL